MQLRLKSIHYFHSYAVADRIDFSDMSEATFPLPSVSTEQLAASLLPSIEDDMALRDNFMTLVARVLVTYNMELTFNGVVEWHIKHQFSQEMSKIVSIQYSVLQDIIVPFFYRYIPLGIIPKNIKVTRW